MLKRILKILAWILGIVISLVVVLVVFIQLRWDAGDGRPAPEMKAPTDSASIAHGEYIYKYQSQCWGCHLSAVGDASTPPSGGFPFDLTNAGPGFGVWYSRNITPDLETGIGGWTDGEIVRALREGVRKDGSPLFPIMPMDWYHQMADDDALALVAYLRSIPPVKHQVPEREPSFVAKALFTFGLMGPKPPITSPVVAPRRAVTAEYGRYVSSNVSTCADCHTPRNLQDGSFYLDSLFAGSSFPFGGGAEGPLISFARNITPDSETGIGLWTEEQFYEAVTTGMRPDGTVLTSHMPYSYYKFWSPEDLAAVYTYLKTVPAVRRTVPPNESDSSLSAARGLERGEIHFKARCRVCHGAEGGGAQPTNVKLAEVAPSLTDDELMEFVKGGQLNLQMPAFGKTLKDDELVDIIAYVRTWEKK